ncbi:MAG: hypothetical protein DCF22_24480 [Leptolyngbya sp.]|nr:MAG: hypothetical protein DCF22_24480 [Leptolyngbya sp.]
MEGIDLVIVGAIAGMIAIANPTLKPLKPDSSNQNRATVPSTIQPSSGYNTPEHAKYRGIRWGGAIQSSGQATGSPPNQSPEHRGNGEKPSLTQAQLDSELASLPRALRNVVRKVNINQGCSPYTGCDTSAETIGGTGVIDVWGGGKEYVPSMAHEAAHLLVYEKYRGLPPGYEEVWRAEGGVSEYGKTQASEDFAEAMQQYVEGRLQSERKREFIEKALNE